MSTRRVTMRVAGLVQGVNYRQAARREAQALGIGGFARNEPDGTVTVDAEGDPVAVERFIAWCRHGPAAAHVEDLEVLDGPPVGYDGFARR
jgi:acylphosphatase